MIPTILAGYGRFGRVYADRIDESLDLDLVAVVDVDEDAARDDGLEVYPTISAALAETPARLVVIATPPAYHAGLAVEALESGLDVLLAKPGALGLDDTVRVATTAWNLGRLVFVDYTPTESPAWRSLRLTPFPDGILTARFVRRGVAAYQDAGALWDLAPHDVALAVDLDPDDKVRSVIATAWNYPDYDEPVGANLHLTHVSGRTTRIEVDWMAAATERRVEVVEYERMHVWDQLTDAYGWTRRGYRSDDRGRVIGLWDLEVSPTRFLPVADNVSRALARVVRGLETRDDDTGRYLEVMRILEAAEQSLYTGGEVRLDANRGTRPLAPRATTA